MCAQADLLQNAFWCIFTAAAASVISEPGFSLSALRFKDVFALCLVAVVFKLRIIKAFNPPQLLSLDNLVSTVKSGGHNHCVGFPPGQRWSVWPGRRLAEACFCPELATAARRGEAILLGQKWQDVGISR